MAAHSKVNRIAGLSLAVAVGLTCAPAATADAVPLSDVVESVGSEGHTLTALAANPTNGRVYAVSNEGHLVRIHPRTGNLKDLGEIPGLDTTVTSAAFTTNGTLVLFDGDSVRTKNLAKDPTGPNSAPADLEFATRAIELKRELPALVWAPTGNDDELIALSTEDGKATLWTLNLGQEPATLTDTDVAVRQGVDLSKVKKFTYASLDGETTTFADDEGNAVTLEDGKVGAVAGSQTEAATSTLSRPEQVIRIIDELKPVASSLLPAAAALAAGTRSSVAASPATPTTSTSAPESETTSAATRSTGRSTSVAPSATVVTRSVKASASTTETDAREGDLADTGSPMRVIIALGVLFLMVGGAYLALGRRRENA